MTKHPDEEILETLCLGQLEKSEQLKQVVALYIKKKKTVQKVEPRDFTKSKKIGDSILGTKDTRESCLVID